jgi:hypothetical protein
MRAAKNSKPGGWGGVLGAALLAAVLTGCEGMALQLPFLTATQADPPAAESTASPETSEESEAQSATAPQPEAEPEPEPEPKTAALPPEPVIDDDPARILGLGPDELTEILGRPELTRREPPAEIWQYRGKSCVFDVFLYEEAGLVRVTYLEARDESAQRVAERNCLNQLLRARRAAPLG